MRQVAGGGLSTMEDLRLQQDRATVFRRVTATPRYTRGVGRRSLVLLLLACEGTADQVQVGFDAGSDTAEETVDASATEAAAEAPEDAAAAPDAPSDAPPDAFPTSAARLYGLQVGARWTYRRYGGMTF